MLQQQGGGNKHYSDRMANRETDQTTNCRNSKAAVESPKQSAKKRRHDYNSSTGVARQQRLYDSKNGCNLT